MRPIVIIPTYNEKENIQKMLDVVLGLQPEFDVLIVDDNSPDGTAQIVKINYGGNERIHLLEREGKQGLGTAYIAGFHWCLDKGYNFIFEMDCDFSHDPNDLIRLYQVLKNDESDLVIGSRYVNNVVNVVNWPMGRVLMSYFASVYVRFITRMKVADATAGFVGYKRTVLEAIDLDNIKFKGYAFQIEMKYSATLLKFRVKEIPIIFTDREEGTSKMSGGIFREALFGVISMRLRSLFSKNPK
ncbi:MAG: polyprenol monophosphomannose synthase [Bacteroidia bacterium]